MNNRKNGLDEMQKHHRNNIGNQMFILMTFLLFINNGLHGAGITWLAYPSNIMVIVTVCLSIYLVRLIASNAYLPTSRISSKLRLIVAVIFSVIVGISAIALFLRSPAEITEVTNDNGAIILMTISAVGLIIALGFGLIKKLNDKDDNDE